MIGVDTTTFNTGMLQDAAVPTPSVAVDAHDALSSELLVPEAAASVLSRPLQLQLCRNIMIEHDNEDTNQ